MLLLLLSICKNVAKFVWMLSIKKILATTALVVIAAPIFLFTLLFVKQKIVQHAVTEKLESASLRCISLTSGAFKWVKENKEIEINGRLFDVKHYTQKDGKMYFTGLYDYEEDLIKKQIADLCRNENKNNSPCEHLLQFLFNPAIANNQEYIFLTIISVNENVYSLYKDVVYFTAQQILIPPPKV